ncbi:MAG: choice-of-anchor E domain-containing protein [Kiritimatiellales bacterium]
MKKKISILASLFIVTGSLQAAVIVQTHNFIATGPGNSDNPTVDTWSFNEFDTLGGTYVLSSVRIQFITQAWDGFIGTDNDGQDGASGTVSFNLYNALTSGKTLIDSGLSTSWASQYIKRSAFFTLAADDGDGEGYQSGGADWDFLEGPTEESPAIQSADITISSFFVNTYEGSGTFNMSATAYQTLNAIIGGDSEIQASGQQMNGSVILTYDYVVPEPAAISLIGLGGIITLTANRIRRRKTV